MKTLLISTWLVGVAFGVFAQNINRTFVSYTLQNGTALIEVSDGTYKITPFTNQIVHTSFQPQGVTLKKFSYAVSLKPGAASFKADESAAGQIILNTDGMQVVINKQPFNISYHYAGNELIAEKNGYFRTDSLQGTTLVIEENEVLYGGGTRVLGMNRRGNKLEMYNRAHYGYETHSPLMNFTMPLFISSKKYAVLFDNASVGTLDLDSEKNNTIKYQTVGGTINYYVIAGNDWYNLNSEYTLLTGRQPLLPRWALSRWHSARCNYHRYILVWPWYFRAHGQPGLVPRFFPTT